VLLANEQRFELLHRLRHRREAYPEDVEPEASTLILREHARQLRN
jgi:hypothetical protein